MAISITEAQLLEGLTRRRKRTQDKKYAVVDRNSVARLGVNNDSASTSDVGHLDFLALPPEIRLLVYQKLFNEAEVQLVDGVSFRARALDYRARLVFKNWNLSILRSNRLIYGEAKLVSDMRKISLVGPQHLWGYSDLVSTMDKVSPTWRDRVDCLVLDSYFPQFMTESCKKVKLIKLPLKIITFLNTNKYTDIEAPSKILEYIRAFMLEILQWQQAGPSYYTDKHPEARVTITAWYLNKNAKICTG